MLYLECSAQSVKLSFELSTVVCPHFGGVTKYLKNLLFDNVCNCFASLVLDEAQNTELTEATNGTQHMHLTFFITQINNEV